MTFPSILLITAILLIVAATESSGFPISIGGLPLTGSKQSTSCSDWRCPSSPQLPLLAKENAHATPDSVRSAPCPPAKFFETILEILPVYLFALLIVVAIVTHFALYSVPDSPVSKRARKEKDRRMTRRGYLRSPLKGGSYSRVPFRVRTRLCRSSTSIRYCRHRMNRCIDSDLAKYTQPCPLPTSPAADYFCNNMALMFDFIIAFLLSVFIGAILLHNSIVLLPNAPLSIMTASPYRLAACIHLIRSARSRGSLSLAMAACLILLCFGDIHWNPGPVFEFSVGMTAFIVCYISTLLVIHKDVIIKGGISAAKMVIWEGVSAVATGGISVASDALSTRVLYTSALSGYFHDGISDDTVPWPLLKDPRYVTFDEDNKMLEIPYYDTGDRCMKCSPISDYVFQLGMNATGRYLDPIVTYTAEHYCFYNTTQAESWIARCRPFYPEDAWFLGATNWYTGVLTYGSTGVQSVRTYPVRTYGSLKTTRNPYVRTYVDFFHVLVCFPCLFFMKKHPEFTYGSRTYVRVPKNNP